MVEHPFEITYDELRALPSTRISRRYSLRDALVEKRHVLARRVVPALVERAKPHASAKFVMQLADNDYTTNLPLAGMLDDDVLVAYEFDGQPVEPIHGGPVRMVVPKKYFWKSAKWLHGIEFRDPTRRASGKCAVITTTATRGKKNATPTSRRGSAESRSAPFPFLLQRVERSDERCARVALNARQRGDRGCRAVDREDRRARGAGEVQRTGGVRLGERTGREQRLRVERIRRRDVSHRTCVPITKTGSDARVPRSAGRLHLRETSPSSRPSNAVVFAALYVAGVLPFVVP